MNFFIFHCAKACVNLIGVRSETLEKFQKKSIKFYHSARPPIGHLIFSRLRFVGLFGSRLKQCSRSEGMTAFNAKLLESSVQMQFDGPRTQPQGARNRLI
jgi:hypothetical protein